MPNSNLQSVTFCSWGFTVPVRVAEVCLIDAAAAVTTAGALAESVVNVSSLPLLVPPGLTAMILK